MNSCSRLAVIGVLLAWLPGCTSAWKSSFVPVEGAPITSTDAAAPVRVREVDWERLQGALRELRDRAAASDVPIREWPEADKAEMKATLLRALQVTQDPDAIAVLGRSDFRTTDTYRPESTDQPELIKFARSIGATEVVWSRGYMGTAETIVREPISTWSYGTTDVWDRRRGRWRSYPYSDQSTTFVPVRVEADQFAYIAYFLREAAR